MALKRILGWCLKCTGLRNTKSRWALSRLRACSVDISTRFHGYRRDSSDSSDSTGFSNSDDTLVGGGRRSRAFSDPGASTNCHQNIYSYYPLTEDESRVRANSPPPCGRHYDTFPALVEMGGFLSL